MKWCVSMVAFLGLLVLFGPVLGQDDSLHLKQIQPLVDSSSVVLDTFENSDDDFTPGLAIYAAMAFAVMLACIGAGMVLAVAGLILIFIVVSMSIISASVIIAVHQKSLSKGFKIFFVLAFGLTGTSAGGISFYILLKIMHWPADSITILAGFIGGLLGGIGVGLFTFFMLKKMFVLFKEKIKH